MACEDAQAMSKLPAAIVTPLEPTLDVKDTLASQW